ncbi:MAG TPA: uracil-DNA glycosylase [Mycobacteriales bacterium]|jgi:uracil-DNA glycosylase family 4|nr:uracil-DNA glycosylase [Mycobacteriales bacterium]
MAAVPPGSEHPAEVASRHTPIAYTPADVARLAPTAVSLGHLDSRVSVCRACPRLVEWRERVADERRASFADEVYWGRPVPSWGGERARVAIVGLAPAAHGGNRTGRIFTGDRSGDWLYAALYRAGLATQPTSVRAGDGQRLVDTRICAAVHCAPPANKPTPEERDACRPWLVRDLELLAPALRVVVALGGFAWAAAFPALRAAGYPVPARRAAFGHLVEVPLGEGAPVVLGCYHPSQQNTFTGRLTEPMIDAVFARAVELARG